MVYGALEHHRCVAEPKGHHEVLICAKPLGERRIIRFLRDDNYLMETRCLVYLGETFCLPESVKHLIGSWHLGAVPLLFEKSGAPHGEQLGRILPDLRILTTYCLAARSSAGEIWLEFSVQGLSVVTELYAMQDRPGRWQTVRQLLAEHRRVSSHHIVQPWVKFSSVWTCSSSLYSSCVTRL